MYDFITYIGHLEKRGSLSYTVLPNVDTSHYITWKNSYLLISPWTSSGKSLTIGKLSSSWKQIQVIQMFNFHLKAWICHWQQILLFYSSEKVSAKYSSLNNRRTPIVLSRINGVPWKRWSIQTILQGFFLGTTITVSEWGRNILICIPLCHTEKDVCS